MSVTQRKGGPAGGQFQVNRVLPGVPQGGQFAKTVHGEAGVTLSLGKEPEPASAPAGPPFERAQPTPGESPTLTRYREDFGTQFSERELGRMAYEFDKYKPRAGQSSAGAPEQAPATSGTVYDRPIYTPSREVSEGRSNWDNFKFTHLREEQLPAHIREGRPAATPEEERAEGEARSTEMLRSSFATSERHMDRRVETMRANAAKREAERAAAEAKTLKGRMKGLFGR